MPDKEILPVVQGDRDAEFLREAARYFERRPTNGEDMAFWANVGNAENCRRIAERLTAEVSCVRERTIEECARVAEEYPPFEQLPDRIIPAHDEHDDYSEVIWQVPERVEKSKRLTKPSDIATAIRSLASPPSVEESDV